MTVATFEMIVSVLPGDIDPPQDGFAVANNQVLAQARTVWVPIDVRTGKPARVSADVRARFSTS